MYSKRPIYLGITFLHLGSAPVPPSLPLALKPESQNVPARSNLAILHEKIEQKRAEKGSPSLIHNKKQCPDARSDLDQLQTYLDLGGGKPSPMAPGNFRSVHWFIVFFGIFRDLYILIRRGEGAPPGTFFSIHPTTHNPSETWWNYPILGEKCQN